MRCPKRGRGGIFNFLCAGGIDHFCCEVIMVSVCQQNLKGKFKPSKNLELSRQTFWLTLPNVNLIDKIALSIYILTTDTCKDVYML